MKPNGVLFKGKSALNVIEMTSHVRNTTQTLSKHMKKFVKYLNWWVCCVLLRLSGSLWHYGSPRRDKKRKQTCLNLEQRWAGVLPTSGAPRKSQTWIRCGSLWGFPVLWWVFMGLSGALVRFCSNANYYIKLNIYFLMRVSYIVMFAQLPLLCLTCVTFKVCRVERFLSQQKEYNMYLWVLQSSNVEMYNQQKKQTIKWTTI